MGQRTLFILGSLGKLVVNFLLVIIDLYSLDAFVLSQCTCLTYRRTGIVRACIAAARKKLKQFTTAFKDDTSKLADLKQEISPKMILLRSTVTV